MPELTSPSYIKDLFARHGFHFTKSLGQNFIVDPSVCPKIARLGGCNENAAAIEIGTGIGVLTRELSKSCAKVLAVEIDERLRPILAETLADRGNIKIVFADVLKTDLKALISEKLAGFDEIYVCANLPYYITSPVIMYLLEQRLPVKAVTVMVQREAADRICAKPGERSCGAVTIAVNYYSEPRMLFKVGRGSFRPAPNVDSAVIRLDIRAENRYSVSDERLFFRIVRAGFSQRRKQMINPLCAALGLSKGVLSEIFAECGLEPSVRAEQLTMENFAELCEKISAK